MTDITTLTALVLCCYITLADGSCASQVAHSDNPANVLREAHEAYQIVRTDFTENKKLMSKANFWKVIYQF